MLYFRFERVSVMARITALLLLALLIPSKSVQSAESISFDGGQIVVPPEIVEGAKKEGQVRIRSSMTPEDFAIFVKPFQKKVPFLRVRNTKADGRARFGKTVTEFRHGRIIADIVSGISGGIPNMIKYDMFTDLSNLPTFKVYDDVVKDKQGRWIARWMPGWGIAYRTDKVSKNEIRTWEDLLNPKWGDRIATANKPHLLPHIMWAVLGPERTKNFLKRFFANKKLQLRKEGSGTVVTLLAAGEYDILFSGLDREARRFADRGAPVAWTFPEGPYFGPMPGSLMIVKGSPRTNAAKLFMIYWNSKEGQIAQFKANRATPAHPELRSDRKYVQFPEEQLTRKIVTPSREVLLKGLKKTQKYWKKLWLGD